MNNVTIYMTQPHEDPAQNCHSGESRNPGSYENTGHRSESTRTEFSPVRQIFTRASENDKGPSFNVHRRNGTLCAMLSALCDILRKEVGTLTNGFCTEVGWL